MGEFQVLPAYPGREDEQAAAAWLRQHFPWAEGDQPAVSPTKGGRAVALKLLAEVDPDRYARSRNFLDGKVTRLAPYLRHGVLSLGEVRRYVLQKVKRAEQAEKLVQELGWRDYWRRVYGQIGDGVWQDREPAKRTWRQRGNTVTMPTDITEARTGLACMDGFVKELQETGYLHNHARMWFASYVIHFRRVAWQAAARFFLRHLLDGDPSSNNLSFQWVASTFGSKPYIFNRENLERYTNGRYCQGCSQNRSCPFGKSYEELDTELFQPEPFSAGGNRR